MQKWQRVATSPGPGPVERRRLGVPFRGSRGVGPSHGVEICGGRRGRPPRRSPDTTEEAPTSRSPVGVIGPCYP